MFLKMTVKVPIDRSVVAARRRLCGGGGGGKRGRRNEIRGKRGGGGGVGRTNKSISDNLKHQNEERCYQWRTLLLGGFMKLAVQGKFNLRKDLSKNAF